MTETLDFLMILVIQENTADLILKFGFFSISMLSYIVQLKCQSKLFALTTMYKKIKITSKTHFDKFLIILNVLFKNIFFYVLPAGNNDILIKIFYSGLQDIFYLFIRCNAHQKAV